MTPLKEFVEISTMDFIIFERAKQKFAISSRSIREILDATPLTPVPFAPDYVDGLINAAGDILLQIDFAKRMRLPLDDVTTENKSANQELKGHILTVMTPKGTYGLRVDKVHEKLFIPSDMIHPVGSYNTNGEYTNKNEIIGEVNIKNNILLIVDEVALGLDESISTFEPVENDVALGTQNVMMQVSQFSAELKACLILQCGSEFFAFNLQDVLEIVKVKPKQEITLLPHAPCEIYGLYLLRGSALAAFSISGIFNINRSSDEIFGVVVQSNLGRVMICVEKMHGIHYYSTQEVQEPVLADSHFEGWIKGKHDEMIGVIASQELFNEEQVELYEPYLVENAELEDSHIEIAKQKFLAFWIGKEKCCLDLQFVHQVAERHLETDLPHPIIDESIKHESHSLLCGITQIQGIVMPIINLYKAFHLSQSQQQKPISVTSGQYVIINCNQKNFALLVDKIDRVIDIAVADIEINKNRANDFVKGIAKINGQIAAILSLEPLQAYDASLHAAEEKKHT